MAFRLTALSSALSAALSGVETDAFTVLYARRQNTDRDADSCELEAQASSSTVSGLVSTGNGTDFRGHANYATTTTGNVASTLGVWSWRLVIGTGTSLYFYYKSDTAGGSWTAFPDSPITQTPHAIATLLWGDNGRAEPFFGDVACLRVWSSAKTAVGMIPEISSRTPIDTSGLVLDKLGAAASLSAALSSGVGTMSSSGAVTLIEDMPATLATVEEEDPPVLSGSADIDIGNPDQDEGVAPVITTIILPSAQAGVPYSQQLTATGTSPITWSATGLPAGMSVSSAGLLSGTPTESGSFAPSFTATNATSSDTESISLTVGSASVGVPIVTTGVLLAGVEGEPYEATLAASGAGPITWELDGLFPGAVVDGSTISGTPTHSGLYLVVAVATNAGGSSIPVTLSLLINPPPADVERYASPWSASTRR